MQILVTGCSGYIGTVLCQELLRLQPGQTQSPNQVVGIDIVPPAKPIDGLIFVQGDVKTVLAKMTGAPEVIYHLAASVSVPESFDRPVEYFANNIESTLAVAYYAQFHKHKPRIVFASTAAVYGDYAYAPLSETDPTFPTNPYGMSKLHCEQILSCLPNTVSLRLFNVAGPPYHQTHPTHIMPKMAKDVLAGRPITLSSYPSVGRVERDYVDVRSVVHTMMFLGQVSYIKSKVYNVCTGTPVTNEYIATGFRNLYEKDTGSFASINYVHNVGPKYLVGNPTLIKETGLHNAYMHIDYLIKDTYLWEKNVRIQPN